MNFKKIRISLIAIITILLLSSIIVYGDDLDLPNPNKSFYVYDEANIIDSNVESYIIQNNEILFSKTGAQIVVVTVNSLGGETREYYANKLFEKWEIGSAEKDNGVLILIAPNEGQLFIEVGYGLEGALPDGKVGEIRDNDLIPYFREGNFSEGVYRGFNSIIEIVKDEYNVEFDGEISNKPRGGEDSNRDGLFSSLKNILIAIGVIILIIIDFTLFNGFFTMMILRGALRGGGRGGGGGSNRGGGGSSGGGGAGGSW